MWFLVTLILQIDFLYVVLVSTYLHVLAIFILYMGAHSSVIG
jgi:hypothetical protein